MFKKALSLFISFTLITDILFLNLALAAELEVDTTAAAKYQATLLKTQNGIDQVNITATNANGVSHNKFTNFNVQTSGMILNNSQNIVNTQLAGHVEGNTNLTGGSARMILNEVTGTNRSHLRGYMEVAGQKADLIVANPNGITVNGGGFINIPNATLTTGQINAAGDMFQVRQGDILIEGQGINANNIDSVNFYTKALKLNAKLYGNIVKAITGSSDVGLDGTVTDVTTTEAKPEFSIDSTALGGIYAKAITLVGNEQGVGINLPGIVYAQDQLTLNSKGTIELGSAVATADNDHEQITAGTIDVTAQTVQNNKLLSAKETLSINTQTVDNKGTIASGLDENLNLLDNAQTVIDAQTINNSGILFSSGIVTLKNATLNNKLDAKINANSIASSNLVALNNSGEIFANSDINLEATDITNNGLISSQNTLTLHAQDIINNALIFSSNSMGLYATNTLTNNKNGNILAVNNLSLAANGNKDKAVKITNDQASIQSLNGSIDLHAIDFENVAAVTTLYSDLLYDNDLTYKNFGFAGGGSYYDPQYSRDLEGMIVNNDLYGGQVGHVYKYNRKVSGTVTSYDKTSFVSSKLLAGQDITFDTDNIYNHNSLISANGDITLSGNVINEGDQFFENRTFLDKTRTGYYYTYGYGCGKWYNRKTCYATGYAYRYTEPESSAITLVDAIGSTIQAGGSITGDITNLANGNSEININPGTSLPIASTPFKNASQSSVTLDETFITLPTGDDGLFVFNDLLGEVSTNQGYFIETNPKLTNLGQFLGSDYMLGQLNLDHETPFLRLGDNFYESKLIENSIYKLTGRGVLEGFGSNQEQFKGLMDNALSLREGLNLQLGQKLDKDQIAALDKDIVWMEEQTVKGHKVLVPVVYLASNKGKSKEASTLIAKNMDIKTSGDITNTGNIQAGNLNLQAQNFNNIQGQINANNLNINTRDDINFIGSQVNVANDAALSSTQGNISFTNLLIQTEKVATKLIDTGLKTVQKGISRLLKTPFISKAKKSVTKWYNSTAVQTALNSFNVGGNLNVTAQNDITNTNSQLNANNINITSTNGAITNTTTSNDASQQASITASGKLNMQAKNDITNTNSELNAKNIHISSEDGGFTSQTTIDNKNVRDGSMLTYQSTTGQQASLSAENIVIDTKKDVKLIASDLKADENIILQAREGAVSVTTAKAITGSRIGDHANFTNNQQITHKKSNITAGGDITILSDKGILLEAANLKGDNVNLASNGNVEVTTVTDSTLSESRTQQSNSFHRDTITYTRNQTQTTQTTNIDANNLNITSAKESLKLKALQANVAGDITLSANKDIDISAALAKNSSYSKSSGSSGLKRTTTEKATSQTTLTSTQLNAGGSVNMKTQEGDITLTATNIDAGQDINIDAAKDLTIQAGIETKTTFEKTETSGMGVNGSMYGSIMDEAGTLDEKVIASEINSGGKIKLTGQNVTDVSSNYTSANGMDVTATNGDIKFLTAAEKHESYSVHKETSMDLNLKALVNPLGEAEWTGSGLEVSVATAEISENKTQTTTINQRQGSITSGGDITMNSDKDITLQATNLETNGDISLTAKNDVNIIEAQETTTTDTMDKSLKGELTVGVTQNHVSAVVAAKAVHEAKKQLSQSKKDFDTYKDYVNETQAKYDNLAADLRAGKTGLEQADLDAFAQRLDELKDDKKYYVANITAATLNLTSKTASLVTATAAAIETSGAYGLSLDVTASLNGSMSKSHNESSNAVTGNLLANKITIKSGSDKTDGDILVRGANLQANEINLEGDDVTITAAKSTYASSSKQDSVNASMTYSTSASKSGQSESLSSSMGFDTSGSSSSGTTYTNASLYAQNINITSKKDTTIKGANLLSTESTNLDVGGDLTVASLSDRHQSRSKSFGMSATKSHNQGGDKAKSATEQDQNKLSGIGINAGFSKTSSSQIGQQTDIVSNGTLNINVKNNTHLKAATLATKDETGADTGKLNLTTKTLTTANIINASSSRGQNISANVGLSADGSSHLGFNGDAAYSQGKTLATLGGGNINVSDTANSSDLSKVNRDVTNTELNLFDVKQEKGNIDLTVNHKLLTEKGRDGLAKDMESIDQMAINIKDAVVKENSILDKLSDIVTAQKDLVTAKFGKSDVINNATDATAEELAVDANKLSKEIQTSDGFNKDELSDVNLYQGSAVDNGANTHLANYDEATGTMGVNTERVGLSQGGNIAEVLFSEAQRKVNFEQGTDKTSEQQNQDVYDRGARGKRMWNAFTGAATTRDTAAERAWNKDNKNSAVIQVGNTHINNANITKLRPRQFTQKEFKTLQNKTFVEKFAKQEGMTFKDAQKSLSQVAYGMVDKKASEIHTDATVENFDAAKAFILTQTQGTDDFKVKSVNEFNDQNINKQNVITSENRGFAINNLSKDQGILESAGNKVAYAAGLAGGTVKAVADDVTDTAKAVYNYEETYDALKQALDEGTVLSSIANSYKNNYADSVLADIYGEGFNEGVADARLAVDAAALATGVVGAVKLTTKVASKVAKKTDAPDTNGDVATNGNNPDGSTTLSLGTGNNLPADKVDVLSETANTKNIITTHADGTTTNTTLIRGDDGKFVESSTAFDSKGTLVESDLVQSDGVTSNSNKGFYDSKEAKGYFENKYGAQDVAKISKNETTGRQVIETTQGQKNVGWNKLLNKGLDANTDYKVGNNIYKTDDKGRVGEVTSTLKLESATRNSGQQLKAGKTDGIKDGLKDDHGGHIIAAMFNGIGEQINYVPMNKKVNGSGGEWFKLETKLKTELIKESKVEVKVTPMYSGNSKRPDIIRVDYTINGKKQKPVQIENQKE